MGVRGGGRGRQVGRGRLELADYNALVPDSWAVINDQVPPLAMMGVEVGGGAAGWRGRGGARAAGWWGWVGCTVCISAWHVQWPGPHLPLAPPPSPGGPAPLCLFAVT